jgi:hypothetical protein
VSLTLLVSLFVYNVCVYTGLSHIHVHMIFGVYTLVYAPILTCMCSNSLTRPMQRLEMSGTR